MNSKQLANVLLKILGLSMCLYSIPGVFSETLLAFAPWRYSGVSSPTFNDTYLQQAITNALSFGIREVIEIGVGIFVILRSRKISEFLFKNEDE